MKESTHEHNANVATHRSRKHMSPDALDAALEMLARWMIRCAKKDGQIPLEVAPRVSVTVSSDECEPH